MTGHANNSADNSVPSVLLGDSVETIYHSLNRGGDDSDTGRWLTSLVTDALEIAAHGDAEQPVNDDDINTMVRWVAQLFNEFELYRIDFNSKAGGSDLIVSASPLTLEALTPTNDHFEGHLSTRYWSLAFDASTRKLDVYLIPSELLLAFTTNRIEESEYKPFITFLPRRHADEYYWLVEKQKQSIDFHMLPMLAKELFGDLIRVASGNVTEQEFFAQAPNQAAEHAQIVAEQSKTDRSFEQKKTAESFPSAQEQSFGNSQSVGSGEGQAAYPDGSGSNSQPSESATPAVHPIPRTSAVTDQVFQLCDNFAASLDNEMHAIIEFAKSEPDNVGLLLKCKHILSELDALRVAANRTSEKLRELSAD